MKATFINFFQTIGLDALCEGLPEEFATYLANVRSLDFESEPEYSKYRKMFSETRVGECVGWTGARSGDCIDPRSEKDGESERSGRRNSPKLTVPVCRQITTVVMTGSRSASIRPIARPVSRAAVRGNGSNPLPFHFRQFPLKGD
jgi:hypothetical protein